MSFYSFPVNMLRRDPGVFPSTMPGADFPSRARYFFAPEETRPAIIPQSLFRHGTLFAHG
jgi:hypothetical protein